MTSEELQVYQEIQWMLYPEKAPEPALHQIPDPRTLTEINTDLWLEELNSPYGMDECKAERAYDRRGNLKPIIPDWECVAREAKELIKDL